MLQDQDRTVISGLSHFQNDRPLKKYNGKIHCNGNTEARQSYCSLIRMRTGHLSGVREQFRGMGGETHRFKAGSCRLYKRIFDKLMNRPAITVHQEKRRKRK